MSYYDSILYNQQRVAQEPILKRRLARERRSLKGMQARMKAEDDYPRWMVDHQKQRIKKIQDELKSIQILKRAYKRSLKTNRTALERRVYGRDADLRPDKYL